MKTIEQRVSALPVYHVPKARVAKIESKIQNGDIICITCRDGGAYSSHVGLAYRDGNGVLRFLHATPSRSKGRQVVIDQRLSSYLAENSGQIGIYVGRPLDIAVSVPTEQAAEAAPLAEPAVAVVQP